MPMTDAPPSSASSSASPDPSWRVWVDCAGRSLRTALGVLALCGSLVGAHAQAPVSEVRADNGTTLMTLFENGTLALTGDLNVNRINGFVGINRATAITDTEVFGVQAPVTDTELGGMYMETSSPEGRPYYGYATAGDLDAYHYLDGSSNAWRLFVAGDDRMAVTAGGNVGIGTLTPGSRLTVNGAIESTTGGLTLPDGTIIDEADDLGGSGLRLPFSGSVDSSSSAFNIENTGAGLAAEFSGDVSVSNELSVGQLRGFVGVNRSAPVPGNSNEVFGVRAATSGSELGGIYVETSSENGRPYYGYATNGVTRAQHYYNPEKNEWSLSMLNANLLTVKKDGRVGVGYKTPDGPARLTVTEDGENNQGLRVVVDRRLNFENALVVRHRGFGNLLKASTFSSSGSNTRFVVDNTGNVSADGTISGGGADVAESFDVEGNAARYEPGDVLVISTTHDRTVTTSSSPRSTRVIGVYATKPGVLLRPHGADEIPADEIPMGVMGVLPTKVTAENGAIQRGDLLVTSSTPGHAMKAQPRMVKGIAVYPHGALLGKALEPFNGPSTGTIEVMVNVK